MKYLVINLVKYIQDLNTKNCKTFLGEIKEARDSFPHQEPCCTMEWNQGVSLLWDPVWGTGRGTLQWLRQPALAAVGDTSGNCQKK